MMMMVLLLLLLLKKKQQKRVFSVVLVVLVVAELEVLEHAIQMMLLVGFVVVAEIWMVKSLLEARDVVSTVVARHAT